MENKMKAIIWYLFLGLMLMSAPTLKAADSCRIYVSTTGHDQADGSLSHPLRSVEKALEVAQRSPFRHVSILIRGGVYELKQPLILRKDNVEMEAYHHEKVCISGGKALNPSLLRKVKDKRILSRIPKSSRKNVYEIDFQRYQLPLYGLHPVGFARASIPSWTEVFVNQAPFHLCRWPNDSTVLIGKIKSSGLQGSLPIFGYHEEEPRRWKNIKDLWIAGYFAHGYADDMIKVSGIDTISKEIHAAQSTHYGFMTGASFRRWYALNVLEELDTIGEYMIDSTHQKIYMCLSPTDRKGVTISMIGQPLLSIQDCSNVLIKGITFAYGRGIGIYMENTKHAIIRNCTIKNMGGVGICVGKGYLKSDTNADKTLTGYTAIGHLKEHIYDDILYNRHAGSGNGIIDCHIYHVGAGGISLGGGDRRTLTPAGNYVENCCIHDFNRIEKAYRPGIWIDGVGNKVSKCDIYHAPSMAILFQGNDHLIEKCNIHHVCEEIDDQGAIYCGRDPSSLGSIIRYCYIHHLGEKHRVTAVYYDDGECGAQVYGNILDHGGTMPILIGGGHYNHFYHNIIMNSPVAIHIDARMTNWGKGMIAKGGIIDQRLAKVKYDQPPYRQSYPFIAEYWKKNAALPHDNIIDGNLFYKIGDVVDGKTEWLEMYNNWTTNQQPGFIDPADPLKGISPDAEIYRKIKDFGMIPFSDIGYSDPEP